MRAPRALALAALVFLGACNGSGVSDLDYDEEPRDRSGRRWDLREHLILPGHGYRMKVSCLLSDEDSRVVRAGAFRMEDVRFRMGGDDLGARGFKMEILSSKVIRTRQTLWFKNNTRRASPMGLEDEGLSPQRTGQLSREQILDRVGSSDQYRWRHAERRVVTRYGVELELGLAAARSARLPSTAVVVFESWPFLDETITVRLDRDQGPGFILAVPNETLCNES